MIIRDLRKSLGDTQSEFSDRYRIPFRTIQNWESGINSPPAYLENMLRRQVKADLVNRRQYKLPDARKPYRGIRRDGSADLPGV